MVIFYLRIVAKISVAGCLHEKWAVARKDMSPFWDERGICFVRRRDFTGTSFR